MSAQPLSCCKLQATRRPSRKLIEVLSSSRPDVGFPPAAVLATWTTADLLGYYAFAGEFDMLEDTSLWEPEDAGACAASFARMHAAMREIERQRERDRETERQREEEAMRETERATPLRGHACQAVKSSGHCQLRVHLAIRHFHGMLSSARVRLPTC